MDTKKIILEEIHKQKEISLSAAEMAHLLKTLSEEIARSELTIRGEKLSMHDAFSLNMKKQLKKGVVSCRFAFHGRLAGTDEVVFTPEEKPQKTKKHKASGGKKLKKDISRLWKEVSKAIAQQLPPSAAVAGELVKTCEDYSMHAHSEWFDLWRNCCAEVKSCVDSAMLGDFDAAAEKINEVNRLTRECHKVYK